MGVRLLGIIYVHDITVARMRGSLKRELEMLKLLAGPRNYRHILLVTTKWGDASRRREFESRQWALEDGYWDDLIRGQAEVHRFDGTAESARSIVSQLNFGVNAVLAIQNELKQDISFGETSIGRFADKERKEKAKELARLSARIPSDTSNDSINKLRSSLKRSARDAQKMDVKLNEQVREWIRDAVREERKRSGRRRAPTSTMRWVLSKTARFFASLDTVEVNQVR